MTRDPRYDILFEPLQIGPVKTKNRFYQVPHCSGMGWMRPETLAAMRGVKAEGGWGVVCTEYNSIHPASDDVPHISASLWDERDVRAHALMTEKVHSHGALAGAELWFGGARSPNFFSREVAMDLKSYPNAVGHPVQTKAMDKHDIADLRRWHRKAAIRAKASGFDIVYVYATHGYLLSHFLDPKMNERGDEYGGSLENRTRLVRELIAETKEAVGDRCAVAVRFSVDERIGEAGAPEFGERRDMFEMLAELPDLWDINIADYGVEMGAARFVKEGALEPYLSFVKSATTKPVVSVGRFTSPDTMVAQLKGGVVDLIGAARPSIADPFLPRKIEEGQHEDIRECIGCNICYTGDALGVPIRCTQNPTMGEEWRKGWHPEKIAPKRRDARVLVVGAGPAGLEAARALGVRGYDVVLAEATRVLGGRVTREAALPGMSEYARVRDYREQQLLKMPNVEIFRESRLATEDVFATEPDHVAIATGAKWQRERFDGHQFVPVAKPELAEAIFTPDDIMDGRMPSGPTVLFDSDGYYIGATIAEKLAELDIPVCFVTPTDSLAPWARNTTERWQMRSRLMALGAEIIPAHQFESFDGQNVQLTCAYTGARRTVPAQSVVLVSQRVPCDALYNEILTTSKDRTLPFTLRRIGDCEAPSIIAAAIYSGHRYARELEAFVNPDNPIRHERTLPPSLPEDRSASSLYLRMLLLYCEEEVMGDAYFRELASRFESDRRVKMNVLAEVEVSAVKAVWPLIDKYGLTLRPAAELEALGIDEADSAPDNWDRLIDELRVTFSSYIEDFKRLEGMAPAADLPALKLLTEHEHAAIRFLDRERVGDTESVMELSAYLSLCRQAVGAD